MKTILAINGSAGTDTSNEKLLRYISRQLAGDFTFEFAPDLKTLPHFDPVLSTENTPEKVAHFRKKIEAASGILICTPEYVFSIPSGLKNLIEWCVAATVFSGKPLGVITASASGMKGHEELQLLMNTLGAKIIPETTLLISGIKAKVDNDGALKSPTEGGALRDFLTAFGALLEKVNSPTE